MILLFDELQHLCDGEILKNKINEIVSFIHEKGIGVEVSPSCSMKYEDDELSVFLELTVPVRLPLRDKNKPPKTFMESFNESNNAPSEDL